MSTFNGLPAHILLVHGVIVLAPLTALLIAISALWAPARKRLVWLVAPLALITLALTPLTTEAGEWLERRTPSSATLREHTELGDTMLYYSLAIVVAAAALVYVHLRERKGAVPQILHAGVAALAVVVAIASLIAVYRIGDSGAKSVWGDRDYSVVDQSPGDSG